jgi:small-conductance mechanosensitive channel
METLRGILHRPTLQEQAWPPILNLSDIQLQQWKSTIRKEERALDRQIRELKVQEDKTRRLVQQLAKKRPQDTGSMRLLAKELVRAKKQRQRMYQSKATLNSVQMQLQEQVGQNRLDSMLLTSSHIQDHGHSKREYGCVEECELFN